MNATSGDQIVEAREHSGTAEIGERGIWQFPGPWVEIRRGTVLATARVAAAPERVFRALFTTELENWWGSVPDGGEFLEVDPPHRVVHTRTYEWDHPTLGRRETKVTCLFAPVNGGTGVTVRHEGFAGFDEAARQHAEGWERILRWLAAYFETDD